MDVTDSATTWTITSANSGTDILGSTGTITAGSGATLTITGSSTSDLVGVSATNITSVGVSGTASNLVLGSKNSGTKTLSSLSATGTTTVAAGSIYINVQNSSSNSYSLGLLSVGKVGITSGQIALNDFASSTGTNTTNATVTGVQDDTTGGAAAGGYVEATAYGSTGEADNANLIINTGTLTATSYSSSALFRDGGTAGQLSLIKQGSGTQTLNNSNTYSGTTTISGGVLNIAVFATEGSGGGTASGIGQSSNAAANLILDGGVLQYTGTTAASTDRNYTLNTTGGGFDASGATLGTLTISGNLTASGTTGTGTLTLQGSGSGATGAGTLSGTVTNGTGSNTTALLKTGTGLWILTSSGNTYTGGTTVSGGTLQVSGSGVIGSTSGSLTVNTGGTFDLNATSQAVGNLTGTGGTITNSGSAATKTLTIGTGNNGGGNFAGAITPGTGGLGLTKTGTGNITLSGTNTYGGPTAVNGGTLTINGSLASASAVTVGGFSSGPSAAVISGTGTIGGTLTTGTATGDTNVGHIAPGANTSGNFGSVGTLTVGGALTIGAATDIDFDLNTATTAGGTSNDLLKMTGTGANGVLTIGGVVLVNFNALSSLTLGTSSTNLYTLISGAASSSGLTASNFLAGAIPSADVANFVVTSTGLQVYFTAGVSPALQSFSSPTPSPLRIIAGATTTVSATLANTATSGNSLVVSLTDSSSGGHGSVTSFASGNPSSITAGNSSSVSGTFTAGTAGSGTWGITNTDPAASPTTASTSNTLTVYNKSSPSLTSSTANFGIVHQGEAIASQTTTLQNASGTYTAGLQIVSLGGLTGSTSLLAAGGSDPLSASVSSATVGNYDHTYTITSQDDSTIVGASADPNQTYEVTGAVYSGLMIWSGAAGNSYSTYNNWNDSENASVHAVPGLDGNYASNDTATFDSTGGGGTVYLAGSSPSLAGITFNSATSYLLAQGTTGTVTLNGGASAPASLTDTLGNHEISAPVNLAATGANVSVASVSSTPQVLTLSGQITGTGGLNISGPGTTILSNPTGNNYSGPTVISGGTTYVNNASGSGTGQGTVTVNGGTLAGKGMITSTGLTVNGGGTMASGDPSQISGTTIIKVAGLQAGGMTLASTPVTIGSSVGTATLAFDLAANNGGNAGSQYSFGTPNNNTTYLKLTGSTTMNFAGSTAIALTDLSNTTAGGGGSGTLALQLSTPYLLVQAGSDLDYLNLVIASGTGPGTTYGLSNSGVTGNDGYVVGVYTGSSPFTNADLSNGSVLPIAINQYSADGSATGGYAEPVLYLSAGNLEVVPEPGTWALMLGGLVVLIVIQRRKNNI